MVEEINHHFDSNPSSHYTQNTHVQLMYKCTYVLTSHDRVTFDTADEDRNGHYSFLL